jgi:3-phenylpropionate/trans-cinnamate dioxygenase ferredoxin reductase subunit
MSDAVPRFWSDQYDAKLQIVGFSAQHDHTVVRGSEEAGRFSIFFYKDDNLIVADSINRPIRWPAGASPKPDEAAAPSFDLKPLVKAEARRPGPRNTPPRLTL